MRGKRTGLWSRIRRAVRKKRQRGFSLIEIMVAMGVFYTGFVMGVVPLQFAAVKGTAIAAEISLATNLASSTLEQLRARRFVEVTGDATSYFDKTGLPSATPQYFTVTWTATQSLTSNMWTDVNVVVRWSFSNREAVRGFEHRVEVDGRVYRR